MSTNAEDASMSEADTDTDGESSGNNNSVYEREPARRVFAAELSAATHIFRESDEDRAPKYALLPTGERMNRCLFIGTLLNLSHVGDDRSTVKARLVDNSGNPDSDRNGGRMTVYAGQYEPAAASALEDLEPPEYVAVVGKPDTFERDDGGVVFTFRPESVTVVGANDRDKWVLDTARATLDRIEQFEVGEGEYAGCAADEYGNDMARYRNAVRRSLESLTD